MVWVPIYSPLHAYEYLHVSYTWLLFHGRYIYIYIHIHKCMFMYTYYSIYLIYIHICSYAHICITIHFGSGIIPNKKTISFMSISGAFQGMVPAVPMATSKMAMLLEFCRWFDLLPSLKRIQRVKTPENGWLEYDPFLLGAFRPIFRAKLAVSFRDGVYHPAGECIRQFVGLTSCNCNLLAATLAGANLSFWGWQLTRFSIQNCQSMIYNVLFTWLWLCGPVSKIVTAWIRLR